MYSLILGRLISIITVTIVLLAFMKTIYGQKFRNKIYYLGVHLFYGVSYAGFTLLNQLVLNVTLSFFIFTIISILFYLPSKKKLLFNLIFYLYLMFVDIISIPIFSMLINKPIPEMVVSMKLMLVTGTISSILLLCSYRMVISLFEKHLSDSGTIKQVIFFILLAAIQIMSIAFLMKLDSNLSEIMLFSMIIGFIGIDIYIVVMLEDISKHNILKRELMLTQQQERMTANYYNNLRIKYEDSRKILHDIKNHIIAIENLYEIQEQEAGQEYKEKILKEIDKLGFAFRCTNPILNVIINDKLAVAHSKQIKVKLNVEDVDINFISDTDITCIVSNLFDNAIEACEQIVDTDNKNIYFTLGQKKNYLVLQISNPFQNEIKQKSSCFLTTKLGHGGIGLSNVGHTVESYDGHVKIDYDNNIFVANIILPNGN